MMLFRRKPACQACLPSMVSYSRGTTYRNSASRRYETVEGRTVNSTDNAPTYAERQQIKSQAREVAEAVLDAYWDPDSFPVDPFKVANELDVSVYVADLPEDVSGIARRRASEKPTIYIASNDPKNRQRFTCAHELGHLLEADDLDSMQVDVDRVDRRRDALAQKGTDQHEIFANEFAANFLMPSSAVRSLYSRGMPLSNLARFFGVSNIAMEHRLKNIGLV